MPNPPSTRSSAAKPPPPRPPPCTERTTGASCVPSCATSPRSPPPILPSNRPPARCRPSPSSKKPSRPAPSALSSCPSLKKHASAAINSPLASHRMPLSRSTRPPPPSTNNSKRKASRSSTPTGWAIQTSTDNRLEDEEACDDGSADVCVTRTATGNDLDDDARCVIAEERGGAPGAASRPRRARGGGRRPPGGGAGRREPCHRGWGEEAAWSGTARGPQARLIRARGRARPGRARWRCRRPARPLGPPCAGPRRRRRAPPCER